MSSSNIETITREHDNFSSSYSELVNLLEKVITNREITQDDKYDLEKAHATYSENYNQIKKILENEKESNLNDQLEEVGYKKLDADLNSVMNILTNNGEKNTFYLGEDGRILIDMQSIPMLTLLVKKLSLIAKGLDSDNEESSITIAPEFIELLSSSEILLKAKNIKLEGYVSANGGFSIDESGNMTANNGNFNGAVNAQGNMTADTLIVRKIVSKDIINSLTNDISVTIATDGDDASTVISSAKFYTAQGFLDALPRNLNGNSIYITLDKECNENLNLKGFSNGDIYLYMNMKNYNGHIAGYNCTAKLFIYGATTVTGIPDGVDSQRPSVMPVSMVGSNTYYYGMYFSNCNFVTLRSINVYGQTTSNSYYAIGAEHGTTLLMQNCKVIGSQNGVQARGSKIIMYKNYGKVNNNAVRAIYGAMVCIQDGSIPNGQLTHDNSSQIIYDSTKCTVDGTTTTVGENTNTGTTTSKSVTFTSDYGDTYRYTWSDWAQDNLVIQGKWTSNSVGCWFFGSDFTKLKGKTITKVVLKIERTTGGSSSNNEAKIVMHNHSSRPSGEPTYLSWSKTANLTMNETTTVAITDSAVLTAIQNGTMKGFGLKHTFNKEHYIKCMGVMKATISYQD